MDFSLFAHMERTANANSHRQLYQEFIEYCQIADDGGMKTIWTGEHHGMDFTIAPNPFINLADIANHTKNVRLGTGTIIAPFWHPIKLAGEAAMTDLITGGRLELGIARGAYSYEYERVLPGLDAWQAGQRMRELVPTLRKLWEGDYAHDGEFYKFPSTSSAPRPLQDGGPPIWIAARDPSSHQFAVDNNCHVQCTPLWMGIEEIESLMACFKTACKETSSKSKPKIMLLHHTYVASNEDDLDEAVTTLHKFFGYFGAWFQNKRPVSKGLIQELSHEEIMANKMVTQEGIRKDLTIGTKQDVIDRIKRYEDLGFDEYAFWIDSGMSYEKKRTSLSRFIDEVMPHFN